MSIGVALKFLLISWQTFSKEFVYRSYYAALTETVQIGTQWTEDVEGDLLCSKHEPSLFVG